MLRGWKAGPKSGTLSCAKSRALSAERWSSQHESLLLGTAEPQLPEQRDLADRQARRLEQPLDIIWR